MKIKSKTNSNEINQQLTSIYGSFDDILDGDSDFDSLSLSDLGYSFYDPFPSSYRAKIKHKEVANFKQEFDNDLYDEQVAFDNRRSNRVRKFTERISMAEMGELSAEELCAYHQFLQDYRQDQLNEHQRQS